jgi:hypothetical protein
LSPDSGGSATIDTVEAVLAGPEIAQVEQDAAAIAECYLAAMHRKGYAFLSKDELLRRRGLVAAFTVKHLRQPLDKITRVAILKGIDRCIDRLYASPAGTVAYGNGFGSGGEEWMYLNDRDYFLTFQYHLWVGLTRQPLAPADIESREMQRNWMRQYLADLPIRGIHEWLPRKGMRTDGVRPWVIAELEKAFADPIHPLAEPLPDEGFAKLQDRLKRSSNGIASDFHHMEVAALTSRLICRKDPAGRFGSTYAGSLPFDDTLVDLWGNGPSLHFASNADFRGNHGGLGYSSSRVYDVVRCVEMRAGDLTLDGSTLIAVRGAKIANVPVKNWFEADKLSDDQLRVVIRNGGQDRISIKGLPPVNGPHRGDRTEGEFFIVVQTREDRLAIINLHNYEFRQLMFWCRPRGARPNPTFDAPAPATTD